MNSIGFAKSGSYWEESGQLVNKYIRAYEFIDMLKALKKGEHRSGYLFAIDQIIELMERCDGYTERDIIMFYSKDLLNSCWDEWNEERKKEEEELKAQKEEDRKYIVDKVTYLLYRLTEKYKKEPSINDIQLTEYLKETLTECFDNLVKEMNKGDKDE